MDIDIVAIRNYYRRLNHAGYGVTELAVIAPSGVIATGFFNNEDAFVKACEAYNGRYNIYSGRNPRPQWFPKVCGNYMDTRYKQRAKDSDIEYITAISLDIDPIRPKGTSSAPHQHRAAIRFSLNLHNQLGGWVDDSGNGAYLWIPFKTPVKLDSTTRDLIKQKCRLWQQNIIRVHQPWKYGLKIDGCYDLSRLKKVIGTRSVKGDVHRLSRFIKEDKPDDRIRDAILSLSTEPHTPVNVKPRNIPPEFLDLLRTNSAIRELWLTPNGDTSSHDWMLGCELIKSGITDHNTLAGILMLNPFGKYQRDRRHDYIQTTVNKLTGGVSGS